MCDRNAGPHSALLLRDVLLLFTSGGFISAYVME